MARRNGRYGNGQDRPGISASTTVPIGLAFALLTATFGGVWWASTISSKLDYVSSDVTGMKNDVAQLKSTVQRIELQNDPDHLRKR